MRFHFSEFVLKRLYSIFLAAIIAAMLNYALASEMQATGKVISTEGHQSPSCRVVRVKRNDNGQVIVLRIPNIAAETSLSAISISALTTGLNVVVAYDPAATTGCGTEPAIIWMDIYANGN